ncbi:MAG: tetraacyldisaccharide 4'-kinase [Desulfobacterota bacterium]|nr:tetraacyldisaccharide 4'-kinase [Thermodesulfobacteriota bacterium]
MFLVDKFIVKVINYVFSSERSIGKEILLSPLALFSFFYRGVVALRQNAYKSGLLYSEKVALPIVSIGNITVGGTGKTPTAIYLARILQEQGKKVGILARGYKGMASDKVNVVSDGQKLYLGPREAGDEPFLIAQKLPAVVVLTGKNRLRAAKVAQTNFGVDVAILDDGFQHLCLKRDLDIIIVDGENPWGNNYLLPRGSLREPPTGIKRADIILVNQKPGIDWMKVEIMIRKFNSTSPIFTLRYIPAELVSLNSQENLPLNYLQGKEINVLAGLARPARFISLLNEMGIKIKDVFLFPDHHFYYSGDLARIDKNISLVTTEKDGVKLKELNLLDREILVLKIEPRIEPKEKFYYFLKKYLPSLF